MNHVNSSSEGWMPDNDLKGISFKQKMFIGAILFFLLVFFYMFLRALLMPIIQLPAVPGGAYGKMLPPVLFAFLYFSYVKGFKFSVFLILFLWIYCWAAEELSIHTGFPFGNYYYTDALGTKLDVVPVFLGVNYLWLLVFPAFFVANLLVNGKFLDMGATTGRILFTAFIAAILISGIDMVVDPLDATKIGEWVWTNNADTGYYGIPYINYLGYVIVMTPAFFIFGLFQRKFNSKPLGPVNIWIALIPLFFYFIDFLMYGAPAPNGVFLVGCFTMLLPVILAVDKLIKYFSTSKYQNYENK